MQQIGKYRVIRLIGEGGMGRVYEASDPVINRRVAIKTISQQVLQNPETRARFIREAQAAGQLSHPNLITIHDIGEDGDLPFIVMEYLEGEELTRLISKGRLALDVKLRVMIDVCQGLAYAHEKGLIHRDIKPANIFVTKQQQVKILDFGLARGLESELTQTGNVVGTPSYMAPEQVRGEPIDQRADIFSAGVVLYELLSGRKPFKADSVAALIFQVLEHQPEPLDRLDPNLPGELTVVVLRALAKKPSERYRRVEDMLEDLKRIKNHTESTVLLTAPPARAARPSEEATVIKRGPAAAPSTSPAPTAVPASPVTPAAPVAAAAPEPSRSAAAPIAPIPSEVPSRQPVSRNWIAIGGIVVLSSVAILLAVGRLNRSETVPSPETQTTPAAPVTAAPPPAPAETAAPPAAAAPLPPAAPRSTPITPSQQTATRDAARPPVAQPAPPPATAGANPPSASAPPPAAEPARPVEPPAPPPAQASPPPERPPVQQEPPPPPPRVVTPAPPATTAPPPAAPPPAPVENSAAGVNDLLMRYKSALEGRDLGALKQIWPALGGRQEAAMKAEFANARAIGVTLSSIAPSISGNTATVTCRREYVVTTNDRKTLNSSTRMTMTLERKNGTWQIENIRHEAAR